MDGDAMDVRTWAEAVASLAQRVEVLERAVAELADQQGEGRWTVVVCGTAGEVE